MKASFDPQRGCDLQAERLRTAVLRDNFGEEQLLNTSCNLRYQNPKICIQILDIVQFHKTLAWLTLLVKKHFSKLETVGLVRAMVLANHS